MKLYIHLPIKKNINGYDTNSQTRMGRKREIFLKIQEQGKIFQHFSKGRHLSLHVVLYAPRCSQKNSKHPGIYIHFQINVCQDIRMVR